jgi:hypothetical protein
VYLYRSVTIFDSSKFLIDFVFHWVQMMFGEFPDNWNDSAELQMFIILYFIVIFVFVLNFLLAIVVGLIFSQNLFLREASLVMSASSLWLSDRTHPTSAPVCIRYFFSAPLFARAPSFHLDFLFASPKALITHER